VCGRGDTPCGRHDLLDCDVVHVVVLTPYFPPLVSGAGLHVADVAEGLQLAGHRVTVVMGQGEPGLSWYRVARVETVGSRVRGTTSLLMAIRTLAVHRRDPVDLVVGGLAHPAGFIGSLAALLMRRPLAVIACGEEVSVGHTSRLARWCLWLTFKRSRAVAAISEFTRDEVIAMGGSPDRCSIVAPGIDAEPFVAPRAADRSAVRERLGLDGRRVVLTVARLEERKGHDVVLDAIRRVVADHPDVHYLIVGMGDDARLRELAHGWDINDRLTIIPHVTSDELPEIFAAADIFAMTSRPGPEGQVEGFGIVYLEAAASELVCIAGSLGGCRDAVDHGVTGWCVDPTDPRAVAVVLKEILDDTHAAKRMGQHGRARVLSSFTKAHLRSRIVDVLEGCVPARLRLG